MTDRRLRSRFFVAIILLTFAAAALDAQVRLGFRFYGGWNYMGAGDLNSGTEGYGTIFKMLLNDDHFVSTGKFSPAHSGLDLGGHLVLEFTPSFGLFLGAGYVQASRTSEMTYSKSGTPYMPIVASKPDAHAVRLDLQAYFSLPTTSGISVVFHAGPEFYLAGVRSDVATTLITGDRVGFLTDASGQGLGFQGGLGLEYRFNDSVGLFLEAVGRYAKFGGFDGTTSITMTSPGLVQNGTLYYINATMTSGSSIAFLMCSPTLPVDPDEVVREAKMDFSGFSLRLGVVFKIGPKK